MGKPKEKTTIQASKFYPPVVVVLGHVDHGKTTLLDAIRKTNVAQKEHGGITQKIGASNIEVAHEGTKRKLTFIDTPGHETFPLMRSRGAKVADLGLLIVSLTDGVMPQTKESIKLLKNAKIPLIVVLTKADLPEKNPEKVKQQLLKEGVILERLGGDIPVIEVSAKTNSNIKELLELILLTYDLDRSSKEVDQNEEGSFSAIIIEAKLDPKIGPKATLVIKNGTLAVRDELFTEGVKGKVKSLTNDQGQPLPKATIGEAVEVLGFEKVPPVGGLVYKKSEISLEKTSDFPQQLQKEEKPKSLTPEALFQKKLEQPTLSLVLCADNQGSREAITNALPKQINFILTKTGEITPADILLAKSTGALVIGFNVKVKNEIVQLASTERVLLKNYTLIYELIDELKEVLAGKELALEEKIYGKAKILASFPYEKTKVLGVGVLEGRIAKGDKVRLLRGEEMIGEATTTSLRQGKNPISKVEKGEKAGVIITPMLDFTIGDMLVCHS